MAKKRGAKGSAAPKTTTVNVNKQAAMSSSDINQMAAKKIRQISARVIEIADFQRGTDGKVQRVEKANGQPEDSSEPGVSQVSVTDPFATEIESGRLLEPPFDVLTLAMLPEHSSELGQCLEAMEVNISGTGYRLVKRIKRDPNGEPIAEVGEDEKKEVSQENADLTNFFANCTDESFIAFRRKLTRDQESTGNSYFEVVRNASGKICSFNHAPSYQMRLGPMDDEPILVRRKCVLLQADGSYKADEAREYRRFRRFCQVRSVASRGVSISDYKSLRWFKEFGDPRDLNKETGEWGTTEKPVPPNKKANEIVHLKIYSPRSHYGLPRFIGNLISIFGDRAAEEINFMTFKNNNIPSMVLTVSNGMLTEGTIKRIESFVESQIQNSGNYSKFLIVEAEPFGENEGEDGGQVKIDIKPLTQEQIGDALFQNYSANNQEKIRRAFRLPPIMVGVSTDMNRAVAEVARRLADEQVFQPERLEFDSVMNRKILPDMSIVHHEFKSNTPNTTDNAQLVRILATAEKTGGMTPRIARQVMEEILGRDLPPFPADFDADTPFSLIMAAAMAQQMPDAADPGSEDDAAGGGSGGGGGASDGDGRAGRDADGDGQVGDKQRRKKPGIQTLKILKMMQAFGMIGDATDIEDIEEETIQSMEKRLTKLQSATEVLWRAQGGKVSEQ